VAPYDSILECLRALALKKQTTGRRQKFRKKGESICSCSGELRAKRDQRGWARQGKRTSMSKLAEKKGKSNGGGVEGTCARSWSGKPPEGS